MHPHGKRCLNRRRSQSHGFAGDRGHLHPCLGDQLLALCVMEDWRQWPAHLVQRVILVPQVHILLQDRSGARSGSHSGRAACRDHHVPCARHAQDGAAGALFGACMRRKSDVRLQVKTQNHNPAHSEHMHVDVLL